MRIRLLFAIASSVLLCAVGHAQAPSGAEPPIQASQPTTTSAVRLIVRLKPSATPRGSRDVARTLALKTVRDQDIIDARAISQNLVSVTVKPGSVPSVSANSSIEAVYVDRLSRPLLQNAVPAIGADFLQKSHVSGKGYAIAVLDSGVDPQHPALSGKVFDEACFSSNVTESMSSSLCPNAESNQFGSGAAQPCPLDLDGCAHGTHVAGIAASGISTLDNKPVVGVAPDAKIVAIQIYSLISDPGVCGGVAQTPCIASWESDQIRALDYVLSIAPNEKIASVNISAGAGGEHKNNCDDDAMKKPIDDLRKVGILTVIAAGNDGYSDALGSPACISSAISVGASMGDAGVATSFSDRARFVTLLAPGVGIKSTWPTALGGSYHALDGTSMSAPLVAGTIALLRSAYPQSSADRIQAALTQNSPTLVDPDTHLKLRRLDAKTAMNNMKLAATPARVQSVSKQSGVANVNAPGNNYNRRVIVTVPPGIAKPSDVLTSTQKAQLLDESPIAEKQFSITAPTAVIDHLKQSMHIVPDTLSRPLQ